MTHDAELVRSAQSGDSRAYGELARRWAPRVLGLCRGRVRRPADAEELCQETLLRGLSGLAALRDPERFGPWLFGIAVKACTDWLRSKQRSQLLFSELAPQGTREGVPPEPRAPGPEASAPADDIEELLREVDALPEDQREALYLFYYDDLSYDDIATLLGVSSATVNARLTRARAGLRRRLRR